MAPSDRERSFEHASTTRNKHLLADIPQPRIFFWAVEKQLSWLDADGCVIDPIIQRETQASTVELALSGRTNLSDAGWPSARL